MSRKKDPQGKTDAQGDVERLVKECDSVMCATEDHRAAVQIKPCPPGNSPSVPPKGIMFFFNDMEVLLRKSSWEHKPLFYSSFQRKDCGKSSAWIM